ncbi:MAG: alpha-L-rhamnosidase N-terminal domain-containing protein [Planctomycetota bacterium]|nr:alpha-L-rhamnosidase N-terminal domain-containing protein [Planctomycetota bacterium]
MSAVVVLLAGSAVTWAAEVGALRCEYRSDPLGVDTCAPRLSWIIASDRRGEAQTAYQVLVASTTELLAQNQGDLWDSGRVASDRQNQVEYAGQPLAARMRCYWKVRVSDRQGQESAWSPPAQWTMGLLRPEDWQGAWIGAQKKPPGSGTGKLGFAVEARSANEAHWVQVDLGSTVPIDRVVLHPQTHNDPAAGGWINGYGFPLRFRVEVADDPDFKSPTMLADKTEADFPNPGRTSVVFAANGRRGRYVRLTAVKLWRRGDKLPHVMTLAEIEAFSGGENVALKKSVAASNSVEGYGWGRSHLTDGLGLCPATPEPLDETPAELKAFPHAPILLRKDFTVSKPVKRATVFFCGLGWSELFIDGHRIGDYVMGPGPTTYDKRVQYLTFDVTSRFAQPGSKTLDVTLYDGWYALERDPWVHGFHQKPYVDQPKLRLDLRLEHDDGSETVIKSDATWQWSLGPIRRAWICEQDNDLRVTSGPWHAVTLIDGPAGRLVAQREPPTRVVERIRPVSLAKSQDTWIYTFDREFTGFVEFRTSGPAGTAVQLATHPARLGPRKFSFILKGNGVEEFAPRQTYTAIAKLTVRGLAQPPAIDDLVGCRVTGVGEPAGSFSCSDETINWLHACVRRTQANYVTFLPNDPTREFKAWTQDIQNMFWSAMWLFDAQAMYERWQYDMLDTQLPDGNLPNVAPGPVYDAYNSPWWGGCGVWLPWELWLRTDDDRLLRESYDAMKRYVDFLERQGRDDLQDWGLTDWLAWESTPRPIVNTPAAYNFASIVSRTAARLGRQDDADRYARLAAAIRDRFNARFLDPSTGIYGLPGGKCDVEGSGKHAYPPLRHETWWTGDRPCTQTGQALPLALGMVPEHVRPAAQQALLREIAAHDQHISAGFIGTPYVLQLLADLDPAVGHALTIQQDFPSWYAMTKGAGCDQLMETWNGGQAFMPSLGGNLAAWHFEGLAGIRPDPARPGFQNIILKPAVVGDLTWVKASYPSSRGLIVSDWKLDGHTFHWQVSIPPNATATVFVPAEDIAGVTEGERPAAQAEGIKFLRMQGRTAVFTIGSGQYQFRSTLNSSIAK